MIVMLFLIRVKEKLLARKLKALALDKGRSKSLEISEERIEYIVLKPDVKRKKEKCNANT